MAKTVERFLAEALGAGALLYLGVACLVALFVLAWCSPSTAGGS